MTAFRITQRSMAQRTQANLQYSLQRMATSQERLSSGRLINRPSDDPVGTVSSLRFRADIRQVEQYVRNADDGMDYLGSADTALTSALAQIRRVRDLTLQGKNASAGPNERAAMAVEVENIAASLIGLANTRHADRPLFGGNSDATAAYDATGSFTTATGATGDVLRTVGRNETVKVNLTGPEVFGGEPGNLFQVVSGIAADLRAGGANLGNLLEDLDAHMPDLIGALGQVGARYNRLEIMKNRADDQLLALRNSLSEVEDIDLPATIMDLQLQETAYQAALSATARVLQPSLVDFLR